MEIHLKIGLLFDSSWSVSRWIICATIVALMIGFIASRICACIEHENECNRK